jgi:hypothetical protein
MNAGTPFLDRKTALARLLRNIGAGILFNEHIAEDDPVVFAHACRRPSPTDPIEARLRMPSPLAHSHLVASYYYSVAPSHGADRLPRPTFPFRIHRLLL